MKAIDIVKARSAFHEAYFPRFSDDPSPETSLQHGLQRMQLQLAGTQQRVAEVDSFAVPLVASLITVDPESMPPNYFVEGKLNDTIDAVANALPDDYRAGDIPPPSPSGFAVLGDPWTWSNCWSRQQSAVAVSWAPAKTSHGAEFTAVALWTNILDEEVKLLLDTFELKVRQAWQRSIGGWYLSRVAMVLPELSPGPVVVKAEYHVSQYSQDVEPITNELVPNFERWVLGLWAVLAGADAPGMDREVERVVELPGKSLEKTARKRSVPGAVSYCYAGQHRPATPPENVGSRGPISVYYWRNGFSKRVVLPDGSVVIRKRRGTWCGDPSNPVSERTKVRITKGTVTRPSDFIPEEIHA